MASLLDRTSRPSHHFCPYNPVKERMVAEEVVSEPLGPE